MARVAREHQLNPNTVAKWRNCVKYPGTAFARRGNAYTEEARVAELERMIGRLTMENDLLKKALATLGRQAEGATGGSRK